MVSLTTKSGVIQISGVIKETGYWLFPTAIYVKGWMALLILDQSILEKYMLEALSFNKASISITTVSAVATEL